MSEFKNRMVAVMNEKLESGKIMNALAHMCMGLGATIGKDPLNLMSYVDADQGIHPHISKMPLVVLKANSSKISNLRKQATSQAIAFTDFTDTMTVGTWREQEQRTAQTKSEEHTYYGIMLFGDKEVVTELTRKFSLWK